MRDGEPFALFRATALDVRVMRAFNEAWEHASRAWGDTLSDTGS
ncbi:hypothetical protein DES52_13018 [Deinococcus yavapaiensis KR-236]|uniref:Uncharacterized protein n=1 Tax=Deinococcus yavapaiensis KR-236 TaxID=694435 RepID=A0A318S598_9DEIO|nr:hypothetical protein DES52_13018 [Deinococcus yavapaiensis KR-236]